VAVLGLPLALIALAASAGEAAAAWRAHRLLRAQVPPSFPTLRAVADHAV